MCNGTLLTNEVANILQKRGILFGVSLDGNELIHNKHRKTTDGKDTYHTIIDNVKNIEHHEYVGCATTLTKDVFDLKQSVLELSEVFNTIGYKPARNCSEAFNEDSINKWLEEYDEISSLHINQTVAYSYVEKSTYNVEDNNVSLISKNLISKEEAINEINLSKNVTMNERSATNATSQVQDEYKQITLTGSITGLSQDKMKYFVKATNIWLTPPVFRGFDYISLNMDNNVQICMQTINGLQRPFFSSSFIYTRTERYVQDNGIFDPIESITTTEVIEEITNTDTDDYKYVIGEGISTGYRLPLDNMENNSSIGNYSEFSITHTQIC